MDSQRDRRHSTTRKNGSARQRSVRAEAREAARLRQLEANPSRRTRSSSPQQEYEERPRRKKRPSSQRPNNRRTDSRRPDSRRKSQRPVKKKRRHPFLLFFLLFILLLLGASLLFLTTNLKNIKNHPLKSVQVNSNIDANMDDYINIVCYGVDSQKNDLLKQTRSDSIIIASINKKNHEVRLASVFRDTYVGIEGHDYSKVNHAYAYGGPDLAVNTLNKNLDLDIQDFITVNFSSLTNVIDALGGITLHIKKDELHWVNEYTKDVARINKIPYTKIKKAGTQTVTGVQATGYCRVRYTKGGDFRRAERQRTVVKAIFQKAKTSNPIKLMKVVNTITPQIYTSLSTSEMLNLMKWLPFYDIKSQKGFPFKTISKRASDGIYYDFPITLSSNVSKLHHYLFKTKNYVPSDTVNNYSKEIENRG